MQPMFARGHRFHHALICVSSVVASFLQFLMIGIFWFGIRGNTGKPRRAMAMAFSVEEEIRVVRNGQAIEAQYPIPPGVVGHDASYRTSVKYDPANPSDSILVADDWSGLR